LIKKIASDGQAASYGLILLDTTALSVKNMRNVDPLVVARLSDASIVVVSRRLINKTDSGHDLKVLNDPGLHLIGMVSNEEVQL
jgi:hypothetical protein